MTTGEEMKNVQVKLEDAVYKILKKILVDKDLSIQDWLTALIKKEIKK